MRVGLISCFATVCICWFAVALSYALAQDAEPPTSGASPPANPGGDDEKLPAPAKVDVQPVAADSEIAARLERILVATDWFEDADVAVRDGVVFLSGTTSTEQYKTWAGDLARKTQDVAAVVNRIEIRRSSLWDWRPAAAELAELWRKFILALPNILFGFLILVMAWWLAVLISRASRRLLLHRLDAPLLRGVLARAAGMLVFLLGLYLVLRISGLTRLAVTVLGGTGLIGLVIGIAFRDITENFLASIFLSMQRPFYPGDLIEITGVLGYVQRLTTRTTIVMTLDGNLVQIPNSIVYKNPIRNFSSNPNRREIFTVGIGYADTISQAQEIALQVLREHPAVLNEPEPWVLVDSLGSATVNLKVYFWLNGAEHSWLKVRSSAIRLVKRAFQEHGISMPDEAREIVFPEGVPVQVSRELRNGRADDRAPTSRERPSEAAQAATPAEGGLGAESKTIETQAQLSRMPEEGEDLLRAH